MGVLGKSAGGETFLQPPLFRNTWNKGVVAWNSSDKIIYNYTSSHLLKLMCDDCYTLYRNCKNALANELISYCSSGKRKLRRPLPPPKRPRTELLGGNNLNDNCEISVSHLTQYEHTVRLPCCCQCWGSRTGCGHLRTFWAWPHGVPGRQVVYNRKIFTLMNVSALNGEYRVY